MSATIIPFPGWIEGRPPTASRGSRPNPRRLASDGLATAWRFADRRVEVARRLAEADQLADYATSLRDFADYLRALLDTWVPSAELFRRVEDVPFPWTELPPEEKPEQRHVVIRRVGGFVPEVPDRVQQYMTETNPEPEPDRKRSLLDRLADWLEKWL